MSARSSGHLRLAVAASAGQVAEYHLLHAGGLVRGEQVRDPPGDLDPPVGQHDQVVAGTPATALSSSSPHTAPGWSVTGEAADQDLTRRGPVQAPGDQSLRAHGPYGWGARLVSDRCGSPPPGREGARRAGPGRRLGPCA